jgi:hypothetical protein
MPGLEAQIATFLARYSPDIAARLGDARRRLRAAFPRGCELVYDNYNALVFAISPTERTEDTFISVAGYPRWVTLFFRHGTSLKDPKSLLEGRGKQFRSIRLEDAALIDTPAVQALIRQATAPHAAGLRAAPALTTIVKAVVTRQRPRRPPASAATRR